MAIPLKTDAAPWSLLVLSEVTVLGISFSFPGKRSAQHSKKFTGCQIPWSSLSRHRKCQQAARPRAGQLSCADSSCLCVPFEGWTRSRVTFPRFSELHVCICWKKGVRSCQSRLAKCPPCQALCTDCICNTSSRNHLLQIQIQIQSCKAWRLI